MRVRLAVFSAECSAAGRAHPFADSRLWMDLWVVFSAQLLHPKLQWTCSCAACCSQAFHSWVVLWVLSLNFKVAAFPRTAVPGRRTHSPPCVHNCCLCGVSEVRDNSTQAALLLDVKNGPWPWPHWQAPPPLSVRHWSPGSGMARKGGAEADLAPCQDSRAGPRFWHGPGAESKVF